MGIWLNKTNKFFLFYQNEKNNVVICSKVVMSDYNWFKMQIADKILNPDPEHHLWRIVS